MSSQTGGVMSLNGATRFADRASAGEALAAELGRYAGRPDLIVLALPRGGVPVGVVVARALGAPLDLMMVRKLGVPGHEELAMGAVATGGVRLLNEEVVRSLGIDDELIDSVAREGHAELERRRLAYRGDEPPPDVNGRTVILVDDGLATGSTMRAAVEAVKRQGPARVVVAVPVAPPDTCEAIATLADEVVCPVRPDLFLAIGVWYESFPQLSDDDVRDLLGMLA